MSSTFLLGGKTYSVNDIPYLQKQNGESKPQQHALLSFLRWWFSEEEQRTIHTSGSTGIPREITITKENMKRSALASISFFQLHAGEKVLLALPLQFIGGMMMVVRAVLANMDMYPVNPSLCPLLHPMPQMDFAPLTPTQLSNSLNAGKISEIEKIKTILLGGSIVSDSLKQRLQSLKTQCYSSYAMTETLSHVALQKINAPNPQTAYFPLPEVKITSSKQGTAIIETPWNKEKIITHDLISIQPNGSFHILGRTDHAITTGGVTLLPEKIENEWIPYLSVSFAAAAIPDEQWGERLVLITERPIDFRFFLHQAQKNISKIHLPKSYLVLPIPTTPTGKIARQKLKEQLKTNAKTLSQQVHE